MTAIALSELGLDESGIGRLDGECSGPYSPLWFVVYIKHPGIWQKWWNRIAGFARQMDGIVQG